jgi:hypothetical protein
MEIQPKSETRGIENLLKQGRKSAHWTAGKSTWRTGSPLGFSGGLRVARVTVTGSRVTPMGLAVTQVSESLQVASSPEIGHLGSPATTQQHPPENRTSERSDFPPPMNLSLLISLSISLTLSQSLISISYLTLSHLSLTRFLSFSLCRYLCGSGEKNNRRERRK